MGLLLREIAIATAEQAAAIGLPEREHGVLFALDGVGARVTLVGDASFVRRLQEAPTKERLDVEIPAHSFPLKRAGW